MDEAKGKHAKVEETTTEEILKVDDRLVVLERHDSEYRVHLIHVQDVVIDQMITVALLELAFALFIAMMMWDKYREAQTHA
jgi:hypothetical protein